MDISLDSNIDSLHKLNVGYIMMQTLNSSSMEEVSEVISEAHQMTDVELSDELTIIFEYLIYGVMCPIISILGIGGNIINIVCFVKQGFKDTVNVSLLGLAVADLVCLITVFVGVLFFTATLEIAELSFDTAEVNYLSNIVVHTAFTRISSWITALITLERCLCICLPLQVKTLVTKNLVKNIIISVFVLLIASSAPMYVVNRFGMKYFPARNKTLLGVVSTEDRENVEKVTFAVNNIFDRYCVFMVTIICTVILVIKLNKTTQWRKKSIVTTEYDGVSCRNKKVAKMVVIISILFIACFAPISFIFIAMSFVPELSIDGKYKNILAIIAGFCIILESINSSGNIFIYYHMSSKYREIVQAMFLRGHSYDNYK